MPTLWDTGSTYLPGRVWGSGTGVNLVVWAGAVPVLFGTPVLPQLFFFVAPAPPFFTTHNPQPIRRTDRSRMRTRDISGGTPLFWKSAADRQIDALFNSRLQPDPAAYGDGGQEALDPAAIGAKAVLEAFPTPTAT